PFGQLGRAHAAHEKPDGLYGIAAPILGQRLQLADQPLADSVGALADSAQQRGPGCGGWRHWATSRRSASRNAASHSSTAPTRQCAIASCASWMCGVSRLGTRNRYVPVSGHVVTSRISSALPTAAPSAP